MTLGRKSDYLDREPMQTQGEPANSKQKDIGLETRTFLLPANNAKHHVAVLPP